MDSGVDKHRAGRGSLISSYHGYKSMSWHTASGRIVFEGRPMLSRAKLQ